MYVIVFFVRWWRTDVFIRTISYISGKEQCEGTPTKALNRTSFETHRDFVLGVRQ